MNLNTQDTSTRSNSSRKEITSSRTEGDSEEKGYAGAGSLGAATDKLQLGVTRDAFY